MVIQYACVMQEWTGAAQRWHRGRGVERREEERPGRENRRKSISLLRRDVIAECQKVAVRSGSEHKSRCLVPP